MAQAAQQINQLMDNLMYKSRLDQTLELVPIDINSFLRRELELLDANHCFKYHIEKHYLFDENLPILFLVLMVDESIKYSGNFSSSLSEKGIALELINVL